MKRTRLLVWGGAACLLWMLAAAGTAGGQDPVVVNAEFITVEIDNSRVRVFEAVLEPGERERNHSHPSSVVHVISGGKVRNHGPDGKAAEVEFVTGDTIYRDPTTHWVENIGTTTLRVLVIELKDPA